MSRRSARQRRWRTLASAALAGVSVWALVAQWWGAGLGLVAAVAVDHALRQAPTPAQRRERAAFVAALPLAADLMAAALRSGAPVDRATGSVGQALGGPVGDRLSRVARMLRLGADPAEAWSQLGDDPGARRMRAAAERASHSGGALAGALCLLAEDLRADRAAALEVAGRRAGVLIVLPLGLCFLPAFLLAGLAPVVITVLDDVLTLS
ncbi:type II secretion system F family protein [Pilimelia columellifera]|uniref:Type II secretion system protein GspF domain-containing protein n=1 Tax=Pilimelia columellifera subsp. columellifera TaxID=706583 RepID=A0ABN3MWL4_9ACTN